MLPYTVHGSGEISLVLMPFLGGSQLVWTESVEILSKHYRCITVDLPGFGDAASVGGYSISEMADAVIELLPALNLNRYLLVGHSMAGKVSAVVARRLVDSGSSQHAPTALVLVTPSPPGPEPMSEAKRSKMLNSLGVPSDQDLEHALVYIRDNISCSLPELTIDRTAKEVLRMNRTAWIAWLESGSKEDWAERVGIIDLPTLIIAADKDTSLGPAVQEKVTHPHFSAVHMIVVECNHLIPIEQPEETAALISNFTKAL